MDRKKAVTIDEDEYSFPDDPDRDPQSATAAVKVNRVSAAPKKGKKGGAKVKKKNDDDDVAAVVVAVDPEDDEESVNLVSSGKKKSSKSKKSCSAAVNAFSPLYSLEEEDVVVDDSLEEEDVVVDDDRSEVVVNNHVDEEKEKDEELDFDFDFGKKKKSKKKGRKTAQEEDDKSEITVNNHVEDEESKDLDFDFGKKKKGGKTAQEEEDLDKLLAEMGEGPPPLAEEVPPLAVEELKEAELDSKKQKKKKKKTKILAELGEGPASSSAPPPPIVEQPVQVQSEAAEAEEKEGEAGDAAKKKKEKEKEKKKAAAKEEEEEEAEAKEEVPAKRKALDNKKLPKHVREMQEAHAFRKMWQERRKRVEEERLRKEEEEERLRKEEEERLARLRRWRMKKMEKVKLLKMKRNSRLFMDKELAELMMSAAIRRKLSRQNEVPAGDAPVEVKERPKYESQKSKQKVLQAEKPRENPQAVAETEVEQAEEDVMLEESQSQAGGVEDKVEAQQDQTKPSTKFVSVYSVHYDAYSRESFYTASKCDPSESSKEGKDNEASSREVRGIGRGVLQRRFAKTEYPNEDIQV